MLADALARTAVALACVLWAGCGKGSAPSDKPDARPPPVVTPGVGELPVVPTSAPCDSLTRQECLGSTHCTLHWIKSGEYECRPDEGPCETNLSQTDKAGCIATQGCLYKEPSCYCPFPGYGQTKVKDKGSSGGACACGGGAPSMCFASGSTRFDAGPPRPDGGHDAGGFDAGRPGAGR